MAGEWGGPVRPEGDPSGWGGELDFKREVRARLAALETRNPLQNASIGAGGLTFRGDGAARSDDFVAGVSGWKVAGDSAEFNDITLRGGIIGNDALTSPVRGDVMRAMATNFSVPTDYTTVASETWAVPDGFSKVAVSVVGKVFAYNPTAGLDYLYGRPRIVRVSDEVEVLGVATPTAASGSNGSGTSIAPGVAVVSFPPGDSLRLEIQVRTAFALWAADSGNVAEVAGSLTWYR